MISLVKVFISLIPVFLFLAALVFLDSYKLVRLSSILLAIASGCAAAAIAMAINPWLMETIAMGSRSFSRYPAPVIEEFLKAVYLVYLIRSKKIGFMVDAAIFGFAIGAGFALIENLYYLQALNSTNLALWIVRGFGTAALHGTTMVLFGIISKTVFDSSENGRLLTFVPGFFWAAAVHSAFNHFIIPPVWSTVILVTVLPLAIVFVYSRSEKVTRDWLGKGMDADIELLDMITSDKIGTSPIGVYLQTLKDKFPGTVVADMLCYLRIHCELAMGAKGILLMRQAGILPVENPDINAKFEELKYLEKSLGKTGRLAILPFMRTSSRDLWQLYMLGH